MYLLASTSLIAIIQRRLPLRVGFGELLNYDPLQFIFNERDIKNSYFPKYFEVEEIEIEEEV